MMTKHATPEEFPGTHPEIPHDLALEVFEQNPLSILITDAEYDEPGPRILYVNEAYCEMSGYTRNEVLGRSPRFMQGPESSRVVLDRLRACLIAREYFEGETWNYRADGTPFLMQWSVKSVWSRDSGKEYFMAAQRDVTELRRLEAVAGAADLTDNVGYVFAGIRHELGNPINSIKAAVTLLLRGVDHYPKERVAGTLERILDELRRVEYLLGELRSYNAYEDATVDALDVRAFLDRFVGMIRPDCEARGCQLELVFSDGISAEAYGDRRGLHQALLNLVTNALDAMEAASCPVRCITLRVGANPAGALLIDVEDTGPGIPPDLLPRIFMPFFTTKRSGTGLGLALVRKVLARMDSAVTVRSTVGVGTTFSVSLPGLSELRLP